MNVLKISLNYYRMREREIGKQRKKSAGCIDSNGISLMEMEMEMERNR